MICCMATDLGIEMETILKMVNMIGMVANISQRVLGRGSKIKLIIFAEYSAKGYPPPLSLKIINFSPTFWMSGLGEGERVGWSFLCLYFITCFRAF